MKGHKSQRSLGQNQPYCTPGTTQVGERWFGWRSRADSWEGNKQVSISVIFEFLLGWDMLATLPLQCLSQGEKSLTELLLLIACSFQLLETCYKTPGKKTRCHLCATLPHLERLCQGEACLVTPKTCSLTPWPPKAPKTSPGASAD